MVYWKKDTHMHFLKTYPKLLLLACSFVASYLLYHWGYFDTLEHSLNSHGYTSAFLGGLLFSFGFTSAFGIAIFAEIAESIDPIIGALLGGAGAFLMDLMIFELVRFSVFHDELHRLREGVFSRIRALLLYDRLPERLRLYLLWSFAGIIIASPLPDEIGVMLVSGITNIDSKKFSVLCFAMNTVGVLVILLLAR